MKNTLVLGLARIHDLRLGLQPQNYLVFGGLQNMLLAL